jgi:hypothetical protein
MNSVPDAIASQDLLLSAQIRPPRSEIALVPRLSAPEASGDGIALQSV